MTTTMNKQGLVIWLYGLSGAGKSTVSKLLRKNFEQRGIETIALDGDELRQSVNKDLGFSNEDRTENIRRAAEIAKLKSRHGFTVICSFITPLQMHRKMASRIIGDPYFEIFLDCPLEICKMRDAKGLYKQRIKNFTGVDAPFERPKSPGLIIRTHLEIPATSVSKILSAVDLAIG